MCKKKGFKCPLKAAAAAAARRARTLARKAVKTAKIGGAALSAYNHYMSVPGVIKGVTNSMLKKGAGATLHDSTFIGPGNAMRHWSKAKSRTDLAARQHDLDYEAYIRAGLKPSSVYLGFSDADKRLMKRADLTTRHGIMAYGGMAVKKLINKTGLTKRIRDRKVKGLAAATTAINKLHGANPRFY